ALNEFLRVKSIRVERPIHPHQFKDGETRVEEGVLELDAQYLLNTVTFQPRIHPEHPGSSAIGLAQPDGAFDRRRLPSTVASQNPEDLALFDHKVHSVHNGSATVVLTQTLDLDDCHFRPPSSCAARFPPVCSTLG